MNQASIKQRAFSLIELMVVVAILGILSSVAIPAFTDYTQRSRATTALLGLQPWQTGITLCWQQYGTLNSCNELGTQGIPASPSIFPEGITAIASGSNTGSIAATLAATDTTGEPIQVELVPQTTDTQISWQVFCSDFTLQPRISRCIGSLEG
ncbi:MULTISPECIES: prepilin-type N-terminal cleavage/methylation domain-containing protein [Gammaproteobacteria]|uniref:pilin n=1 Tax=Gammaproteobacteria TaxID=1236 RepID=UPI0014030BBC|nr:MULTISPECIES: prepilin-type N-terminal cleavage/methylation domain-containing protein [Gammaproteobacteria]